LLTRAVADAGFALVDKWYASTRDEQAKAFGAPLEWFKQLSALLEVQIEPKIAVRSNCAFVVDLDVRLPSFAFVQ